ncbi:hypothetical protein FOZ60_016683 [Perkinsus olseni]|uniref:Uncharacterized protein n=2 Tax=Perkinsus olseni TaxID=32597 RepID=A0A7J6PKM1_PEROL|nr:hypothetical protein FOZ60_016683 [Perkinsus olseni]
MFPPPAQHYPPAVSNSVPPTPGAGSEPAVFWPSLFPAPMLVIPRTPFTTYPPPRPTVRVESMESVTTVVESIGDADAQRSQGLSDRTVVKTEASQPAPAACERQNKNVEEKSSGVVPVDATAPAAPSEKVEVDGMAHERDSEAEVEDKVANKLNTELKELLMEARRSEERYDCIKLEIDTLRDLNRSRSGLIDEAKKLVHALREELLDKEISLRQLQNEKEQLELDLRLIDDDARFIEEELTRLQTRAEKAQAEADAKFIRDELAKLKAGEEDVEDEEDVSGEDEEYEESSSEADEDEEEEEESYEFEEDDGSSGLDDNSEV